MQCKLYRVLINQFTSMYTTGKA